MGDANQELDRIRNALATDDNACTADPIFVVQQKVRDHGLDTAYTDLICWSNSETEVLSGRDSDFERFAELEALYDQDCNDARLDDWTRTGYRERWEFVQPFLTWEAAEDFRVNQSHNLGETRVYVDSAHRNPEWRWLRAFFAGDALRSAASEQLKAVMKRVAARRDQCNEDADFYRTSGDALTALQRTAMSAECDRFLYWLAEAIEGVDGK